MDRELESLLLAYDAWLESGEDDAARREAVFKNQLEVTLAGRPNLTEEQLLKALRAYYPRWVGAQKHPPTLPPKAWPSVTERGAVSTSRRRELRLIAQHDEAHPQRWEAERRHDRLCRRIPLQRPSRHKSSRPFPPGRSAAELQPNS